jgi:hypothetical protein
MEGELPPSPTPAPAALSPLQQEQELTPALPTQEYVAALPGFQVPKQEDNDWHGLGWRALDSQPTSLQQPLQQPQAQDETMTMLMQLRVQMEQQQKAMEILKENNQGLRDTVQAQQVLAAAVHLKHASDQPVPQSEATSSGNQQPKPDTPQEDPGWLEELRNVPEFEPGDMDKEQLQLLKTSKEARTAYIKLSAKPTAKRLRRLHPIELTFKETNT